MNDFEKIITLQIQALERTMDAYRTKELLSKLFTAFGEMQTGLLRELRREL